jgi:ABC-2 type transport system permease protein
MLEVFRFELEYQSKRWWTWVYFAAMLGFSLLIATQGSTQGVQAQGYLYNGSYAMAMLTMIGGFLGLLVTAAFSGDAAARDPEIRIAPLIYTTPVSEPSYVLGRFLAALLLTLLAHVLVQVALVAGTLIVDLPKELMAPFALSTYLSSFVLFSFPNVVLATALCYSLSLFTRRSVAGYLAAVVLFFLSLFIFLLVAQKFGRWDIAKVVDPLGMAVIQELDKTMTVVQRNTYLPWRDPSLLLNRIIWLSVAGLIVALTHLRFRFRTTEGRRGNRETQSTEETSPAAPITVPRVERSSRTAVRLQQLATITAQSFREVAISWGALILVILTLTLVFFGPSAMSHLDIPVVPTTEQMINWIGHTGEILWFIVPVLMIYYAGELVWRDRETRLSEIADATPVPEWVQMVGKFFGLALLIVSYLIMQIFACMIIQAQMGYYEFQPGLYARAVLGLSQTEHLLFAALALAVHVIINQKYLGYLTLIVVYALMQNASLLGIQNHLLVFASSPEWTYTDMRGFGPSLIPWMWFKSYWAGWALLLLVAATLLLVRGKEASFKARRALFRERLTPRALGSLVTCAALIIMTGGFTVYNTTVVNPRRSNDEWLGLWARYEKTYGKFASLPQPTLGGISLRAELFPKRREATIHTTYTLLNLTDKAIPAVHFLPDDEFETSMPVFDRPARRIVDDSELYYQIHELGIALQPGDSLRVRFDVHIKPRGFASNGIDPSVTGNGTFLDGNDWLPVIGYERAREVNGRFDREDFGLPPRPEIPSLDDTRALNSTSAKRIRFDAVISTDEDQTAVAPGELKRSWTENGRRFFHYVADAPIRNDFTIFSARYAVRTDSYKNIQIEVVHHPDHKTTVESMIRSARASLDYFTRNFGPYPYGQLRFVEYPGQSLTMHASPINITFQEAFSGLNSGADERGVDFPFAVAAHEVAHQWWGNQMSPASVEGGPLLSEALAWFSAMCIVAEEHGEDHLQRLLDLMHGDSWTISTRAGPPLLRIYNHFASYRKGPFAMYALREYLGEDVVNTALRRMFDKFKTGEPPLPTSRDLSSELAAVTPDSLRPLLGDLFERNTWWETKTTGVTASAAGNGRWRVTLEVLARKVVVDTTGAETEVPMNDLVEVAVYAAGGKTTRGVELYRALHRLKAGSQRITVLVGSKPVAAGVDPRNLLIDAAPSDNIKGIQSTAEQQTKAQRR